MKFPEIKILNQQSLVLASFALVIGTGLWLLDTGTKSQISRNEELKLQQTLTDVLPTQWFDNNLKASAKTMLDTTVNVERTVYTATLNNQNSAAIISARAADGYAGNIDLMIGILMDGTISGVRVLQHQETPGLGDDIELRRSDWILSFNNASLNAPAQWSVKRDGGSFDQFTGATITPRAVVNAVQQTLQFFNTQKADIFASVK